MNEREQRGLAIAATQKLTRKGKAWIVPSQSGAGKYTVLPDEESPFCSCPDHEHTGGKCKHIYAVQYTIKREVSNDGTVTETRSVTFTEKKSYKQNWPVYNSAQMNEKNRFHELLFDLCRGIEEPAQAKTGRKRTLMADMVFCAASKVYSTVSSRRFGCELKDCHAKGYITHEIHPVSVCAFLESELMTSVLRSLIAMSAKPLESVETTFAVDSSGFSTSRFIRWFDQRYGHETRGHDWVKCHIMCGTKTHIITAVEIKDRDASDSPQFKPLVNETAKRFTINEVSADKGYSSADNLETVASVGGTPFIAFKRNATGKRGGLWEKMFHFYNMNREDYLDHYHRRSNVETAFSMIKAKFRDHVRSRTNTAMENEVLCKILCHNICCVIMSQYELGIEATFWKPEIEPTILKGNFIAG